MLNEAQVEEHEAGRQKIKKLKEEQERIILQIGETLGNVHQLMVLCRQTGHRWSTQENIEDSVFCLDCKTVR
jgi:hypothetical protein